MVDFFALLDTAHTGAVLVALIVLGVAGWIKLRHLDKTLEIKLDHIDKTLEAVIKKVGEQNGRVTVLEKDSAVSKAQRAEHEKDIDEIKKDIKILESDKK